MLSSAPLKDFVVGRPVVYILKQHLTSRVIAKQESKSKRLCLFSWMQHSENVLTVSHCSSVHTAKPERLGAHPLVETGQTSGLIFSTSSDLLLPCGYCQAKKKRGGVIFTKLHEKSKSNRLKGNILFVEDWFPPFNIHIVIVEINSMRQNHEKKIKFR